MALQSNSAGYFIEGQAVRGSQGYYDQPALSLDYTIQADDTIIASVTITNDDGAIAGASVIRIDVTELELFDVLSIDYITNLRRACEKAFAARINANNGGSEVVTQV